MRAVAAACVALALALSLGAARAADLAAPEGPVLVTVIGAIGNANRGPTDAFDDALFTSMNVTFERAAAFDRAMLEGLGVQTLTTGHASWPARYTFTGPRLRDVLKAAGATGKTIRVRALDGYAAEIAVSDLESYPAILALTRDGRPLGLGGRGPAWVVLPHDDVPELKARDDAQDVWSAFLIEVE